MEPRDDPESELSQRERAHLRHRDRKRVTPMVVDNASLRRTQLALAERRRGERQTSPPPGTGVSPS